MPIYCYQCEECNAHFKLLLKNGGSPSTVCPQCNSDKVKRLLPRIGVIYKGKGYYTTDYRNKTEASSSIDEE
jgi:putative FmdB family regulatory protein